MNKILIITGPTATGKTDLGLELAQKYNGELIACDSRQIYIGLDIGSGKLPGGSGHQIEKHKGMWIVNGIPIWLYDLALPKDRFSVKDYVDQCMKMIEEIVSQGKLPIIVGGTGYYLKGLLEGFETFDSGSNYELRKELDHLGVELLQEKLIALSPDRFSSMNNSDKNNPRRLSRAVEIILTGNKNSRTSKIKWDNFDILKIGITASRDILYQRIDQRVDSRIKQGMIEEAVSLREQGLSYERMRELGLEYRCLADLLEGNITHEEFVKTLKTKIHQFAKRQLTYLKNQSLGSGVFCWFDIAEKDWREKLVKVTDNWYHSGND